MPTDSKVNWIVLEKMSHAISSMPTMGRSALHPSSLSPNVVLSLLSAFIQPETPFIMQNRFPKARIEKNQEIPKKIPIGLRRCMPHGWINAFMQLVLFLPGFSDLFSFLPRSMDSIREFADQYHADQIEKRFVSLANGADLVRCLMKKLSHTLFRISGWVDLYAIFLGICELLSFQYEWKIVWDVASGSNLLQLAQKTIEKKPPELLVCIRGMQRHSHQVQRQFFTSPDWLCYDLDAFIEYRPDGQGQAEYIAYIKSEGTWYQCNDERVTVLRSSALSTPLLRAVLLHYRKIHLV